MPRQILFIADPWKTWHLVNDSTAHLAAEAGSRGDKCFLTTLPDLIFDQGRFLAHAQEVSIPLRKNVEDSFTVQEVGQKTTLDLKTLSAIVLRKDPPVDLTFFHHLQLLLPLEGTVPITNAPTALLKWNEKLSALLFPHWLLPSVVTQQPARVPAQWKDLIQKDLTDAQGKGVQRLQTVPRSNGKSEYRLYQPFNPRISEGDKRVFLLNGEFMGVFVRVPAPKEFRSNLRYGSQIKATTLTPREQEIVSEVGAWAKKEKLFLLGLDVLGENLSEINMTSPTGFQQFLALTGQSLATSFWDKFWHIHC